MQQTNEEKNLILQAFLAVVATVLAIVAWFQVAG